MPSHRAFDYTTASATTGLHTLVTHMHFRAHSPVGGGGQRPAQIQDLGLVLPRGGWP